MKFKKVVVMIRKTSDFYNLAAATKQGWKQIPVAKIEVDADGEALEFGLKLAGSPKHGWSWGLFSWTTGAMLDHSEVIKDQAEAEACIDDFIAECVTESLISCRGSAARYKEIEAEGLKDFVKMYGERPEAEIIEDQGSWR